MHEPCLYYKKDKNGELILILRVVDDFLVAAKTEEICDTIRQQIERKMANPLNRLSIIRKYNGVNISQTKYYNHISAETYIARIVTHHNWHNNENISNKPVPMRDYNKFLDAINNDKGPEDLTERRQLEKRMGFNYRQAIGELIYALTICQIDISTAIILLSQHNLHPAEIHYKAVKDLFLYLYATRKHGITYWRQTPSSILPEKSPPQPITSEDILQEYEPITNATELMDSCDITWGSDKMQRRRMSGIIIMLAGGAIFYRTRLQPTIALSTTEAEFTTTSDTGKAVLYLRMILEQLGILQPQPTKILADNRGAIQMTKTQQSSRRTKHIDIKYFSILQWTEDELITFQQTKSECNFADSLSKITGKCKFHQHADIFTGRRPPQYIISK